MTENAGSNGENYLPYRFTGKELDSETGLYYYGARYLDAKYSRWISTDPALKYYVSPDYDGSSGGIFNSVNLNLYHYGNNNPIKYVDPDGRDALHAELRQGNFKERGWFSKNIDEPVSKFCARNFFGIQPDGYVGLMDGKTIVPMSESGTSFSNSEKTIDCMFFCLTAFASAFKLAKASNAVAKVSSAATVSDAASSAKASNTVINEEFDSFKAITKAATGKGNFSMGTATQQEADALGKAWVGEGYRMMSKGKGLVSADDLRTYRFPSAKSSSFATTGVQANFERLVDGKVISNGHLNILP